MTAPDAMKLLKERCDEISQAKVAAMLGYSPATVNTILKGTHPNPEHALKRVIEVFGGLSVDCPVLGEIPLARCSQERKKREFVVGNSQMIALFKACPNCKNNR